jgi:hypothetical protein
MSSTGDDADARVALYELLRVGHVYGDRCFGRLVWSGRRTSGMDARGPTPQSCLVAACVLQECCPKLAARGPVGEPPKGQRPRAAASRPDVMQSNVAGLVATPHNPSRRTTERQP